MRHGYAIKVIRDDGVECGEITIPCEGAPGTRPAWNTVILAAQVIESIRRGEEQAARLEGAAS